MDQIHVYAYEALGVWQITAQYRGVDENGDRFNETLYSSQHSTIDDADTAFRALLLLSQMCNDLSFALQMSEEALPDMS